MSVSGMRVGETREYVISKGPNAGMKVRSTLLERTDTTKITVEKDEPAE